MFSRKIYIYFICACIQKKKGSIVDTSCIKRSLRRKKKEEKKNKKKEKVYPKNVTAELGAMFESDSCKNESSCSSDSSDEDFCIVQKRKRG